MFGFHSRIHSHYSSILTHVCGCVYTHYTTPQFQYCIYIISPTNKHRHVFSLLQSGQQIHLLSAYFGNNLSISTYICRFHSPSTRSCPAGIPIIIYKLCSPLYVIKYYFPFHRSCPSNNNPGHVKCYIKHRSVNTLFYYHHLMSECSNEVIKVPDNFKVYSSSNRFYELQGDKTLVFRLLNLIFA